MAKPPIYDRTIILILILILFITLIFFDYTVNKYEECYPYSMMNTALIIPYRNRPNHLKLFIKHFKNSLHNLNSYSLYVVSQEGNNKFNKGLIMNIAFNFISKNMSYMKHNCYVFHDVDLIPQHSVIYSCHYSHPLHISTYIDEMRFNLIYKSLVGGVIAFTPQQFIKVNGFSNLYQGWGAEDDDMSYRILNSGMKIIHAPYNNGKFHMIKHVKREKTKNRNHILASWRRWPYDGLNIIEDPTRSKRFHEDVDSQIKNIYTKFARSFYNITIDKSNPDYINISVFV